MNYLKRIVLRAILWAIIALAFYYQDQTFWYDHPQLLDHVHHLQTLATVSPDFKQRVRACWDYTQWRPFFDTVEVEGKDTNFGFGLLCDDGSFIGAFIVESNYPTYRHYNAEETLLLSSIS